MHMFFFKEEYEVLYASKELLSNTSGKCQIQILPKNESVSQIQAVRCLFLSPQRSERKKELM